MDSNTPTPPEWPLGVLILLGNYVLNIQKMGEAIQQLAAEVNTLRLQVAGSEHEHGDEGLGFPGTSSFLDGDEPVDGKRA